MYKKWIKPKNNLAIEIQNLNKTYKSSSKNIKAFSCPSKLNSAAIDELLVIFLVAAKAKGISSFKNLGELNKKESPRLDIAVSFLKNIGVKVERKKDDIKIFGNPKFELNKSIHIKNYL